MTIVGLLMALVFGFLTIRNFATGRKFFGGVSALGMLLGLAVLWVEYETAGNPQSQHGAGSSSDPWAKDS
jgi:hypothetical protein